MGSSYCGALKKVLRQSKRSLNVLPQKGAPGCREGNRAHGNREQDQGLAAAQALPVDDVAGAGGHPQQVNPVTLGGADLNAAVVGNVEVDLAVAAVGHGVADLPV